MARSYGGKTRDYRGKGGKRGPGTRVTKVGAARGGKPKATSITFSGNKTPKTTVRTTKVKKGQQRVSKIGKLSTPGFSSRAGSGKYRG